MDFVKIFIELGKYNSLFNMKRNQKLVILPLLALFLGGCFSTSGKSKKKQSSNSQSRHSQSSQNSQSQSESVSVPEVDPTIEKTKLLYDYDDYNANNAYGTDNCPLTGNSKLLIIPIWFNDSSNYIISDKKESVRSDIEKAYIGTNDETGWRSVKTYYQEESLNKLNLQATVADWYSTGTNSSTYKNGGVYQTLLLVETASDAYFTNHSDEKRTDYDTNGDGYLDGVMLIYAAPNEYDTNFWAYCYWLQQNEPNKTNPVAKTFFWASYDFMYDSYNIVSHTGKSGNGGGDCTNCQIDAHTFIHEMGHVLGLEDYYDYNQSTAYCPAGGFSMQDWNMGGHDPYSVMAYGWAEPFIPTSTTTIHLRNFQATHDLILLANHEVDSPFDEYILLELYSPTGLNEFDCKHSYNAYDKGPQEAGIRLWHVDARLVYATAQAGDDYNWSNEFITDPTYSEDTYGVYHVMANSYGGSYASVKGSSYYNYNLLQVIRNSTKATYKEREQIQSGELFKQGSSFDMSTYKAQFYNSGKMNTQKSLGWSFTVDSLDATQATITVTKE